MEGAARALAHRSLFARLGRWSPVLYGLAGLILGFLVSIGLGVFTPAGAGGVASALAGVFTSPGSWSLAFPYYAAILFSAVGLAVAYRAGFITIGADGQLIVGMVVAFWLLYFHGMGLAVALIVAGLVGALYGLVVAALRVWLGVNETLSSLMLNYVAVALVNYLVGGPWSSGGFTKTPLLPSSVSMSASSAAFLATLSAVGVWLLYRYTRLGVAVDAVGGSRRAAETYGASFAKTILVVALLGGFLAGLGGAVYLVAGQRQITSLNIYQGLGYGYMGILAAWLVWLNPLATIASSLFIALLYLANTGLQLQGVPWSFALGFQAVIVLFVTAFLRLSRREA